MKFFDHLTIPLGKPLGVPLQLHWSFTMFAAYLALTDLKYLLLYLGVIITIILHEYGHCIAALKLKIPVSDINIFPIGGAASIAMPHNEPVKEFLVTVAGPPVNAVIGFIFYGLSLLTTGDVSEWLRNFAVIQMAIVIFNCLPVFPMDGGRILRSVLGLWFTNHYNATLYATRFGQFNCIALAVLFLFAGNFWIPFIMFVIGIGAEAELRHVKDKKLNDVTDEILTLMISEEPSDGKRERLKELLDKDMPEEVRTLANTFLQLDNDSIGSLRDTDKL